MPKKEEAEQFKEMKKFTDNLIYLKTLMNNISDQAEISVIRILGKIPAKEPALYFAKMRHIPIKGNYLLFPIKKLNDFERVFAQLTLLQQDIDEYIKQHQLD